MMPGKNPASITPSKARHTWRKRKKRKGNEKRKPTMRPPKFWTNMVHVVTIPQDTTMREIHRGGLAFFNIKLLGTSKTTYLQSKIEEEEEKLLTPRWISRKNCTSVTRERRSQCTGYTGPLSSPGLAWWMFWHFPSSPCRYNCTDTAAKWKGWSSCQPAKREKKRSEC